MTIPTESADLTEEQRQRLERLAARRSPANEPNGPRSRSTRHTTRRHAAKGSRRAALALSLATTGALTAFFHSGGITAPVPTVLPPVTVLAAAPDTTVAGNAPVSEDAVVAGDAISTRFGPVQVQATFAADGSLTSVDAVLFPDGDRRSLRINQVAVPILNREALSTQSAQVDIISGATYTSVGYARSLQSAIDAANVEGITLLT
jgi:uncharacterized protein with FMN-binding domain